MPTISVGPPVVPLHYVGIDVTGSVDTVAWAELWNKKFFWRNLLSHLPTDPADENRLLDDTHPTLPILTLKKKLGGGGPNFTDTIIAPCGDDAKFADKNFNDPASDMLANVRFVKSFVLNPGVSTDSGSATLSADSSNSTITADIVYISSHGTAQGDMYSDDHDVTVEGRRKKMPFVIFTPAHAADKKQKFSGVKWLILSNCNTLRQDINQDWLEVMQGSSLRGILGFQDLSPGPDGSVNINRRLVRELAGGATFKDAWNKAVSEAGRPNNWVVICHEDAVDDTISAFNTGALKPIASTVIKRFTRRNAKDGLEMKTIPDPFEAFWVKLVPRAGSALERVRITSANRLDEPNHLSVGDTVLIEILPPKELGSFSKSTEIEITLHYIREDYGIDLDIKKMFNVEKIEGFKLGVTQADSVANTSIFANLKKNKTDTWLLSVRKDEIEDIEMTLTCLEIHKKIISFYPLWIEVAISPGNDAELTQEVRDKLKGKFRRNGSISAGRSVSDRA
jgi:hypothetical protein